MSRQERGIPILATLESLIHSPQKLEALIQELHRLNDNLEALRGTQSQLEKMAEAGLDVRKILAHEFNWEIKDKDEKIKDQSDSSHSLTS
ncbi:MAG: hypothetical protein Q7S03_02435 [bacterium]|nr:hypothetical protein [bacterium]